MEDTDARRIFNAARQEILEWYDGYIQAVFDDPSSGCWLAFATQIVGRRRRYCLVRVDQQAMGEAETTQFESDEAVMTFGASLLASASLSEGYEVDVDDESVKVIRRIPAEEAVGFRPKGASELFSAAVEPPPDPRRRGERGPAR